LTTDTALIDVVMPQMGVSVTEGTIAEWRKQVGDAVAADETVCEISTDKIDTECPSPAAGTLAEILVKVGETVEVGTVLARIATAGGAGMPGSPAAAGPPAATASSAPPSAAPPAANRPDAPTAAPGGEAGKAAPAAQLTAGDRHYSPVVRRVAGAHDIDLSRVAGTGRGGRVTKRDVMAYVESDPPAPPAGDGGPALHSDSPYRPDPEVPISGADTPAAAQPASTARPDASASAAALPGAGGTPQPLSRMRDAIGQAMRSALDTAAHCTTIVECDMSAIERRRRELGLTALPLVARAVVETLREFPALNATLEGDTLTRHERINLGIAVSLGEDGLIVPVIHDAQDLAPEGLGQRIRDYASRAREKRLSPDDVHGGTFTITSPGAFGALIATPVINVPEVAILDLEAIVKRPVVVTAPDGTDSIAIRPMVNLCMSWDHRALDGAYAAQFLTALRRRLEATA
jgi:pyruvate/2-oxoglutarate dehydrogenase complex dihydrolipoamide acyltransferase (E2) component